MITLILMQIQEQMDQAVECITARQYPAGAAHFRECAELCAALELERQAARAEKKNLQKVNKQLTIDIPT